MARSLEGVGARAWCIGGRKKHIHRTTEHGLGVRTAGGGGCAGCGLGGGKKWPGINGLKKWVFFPGESVDLFFWERHAS